MNKNFLFLTPLCISTHIFAMKPEKNIAPFNWRSQCVPVKSSQMVPLQCQFDFNDTLTNAYALSYDIQKRKYWLKIHGTLLRDRLENLKNKKY
jgi:hypothetical protein